MRLILGSIVCVFLASSAIAAEEDPKKAEERSRLLADLEKLESDPYGRDAYDLRKRLMKRIGLKGDLPNKTPIKVHSELVWEMVTKAPDSNLLFDQYVFGFAAAALRNPTKEMSAAEGAEAGFTSTLRIYRKALERDHTNRNPFLDELNEHERTGTLKQHVERLVEERITKNKTK